jgi:hypothetical protein
VTGRPLVRPSAADDHSVEGIGDRIDCHATHCSDYLCFSLCKHGVCSLDPEFMTPSYLS